MRSSADDVPRRDAALWESEISSAVGIADPVLCNLRITLTHHELSHALHRVTGPDTGANFHTWAVWGSRKAGRTIRQEDLPLLEPVIGSVGAAAGAGAARFLGRGRVGLVMTVAAVATGGAASALARRQLDKATQRILGGNITVLDDIGRATGRFISTFDGQPEPDPARLSAFLDTLRPGPTAQGGQDLLRRAYTHYYLARHEADRDAKHEHMLLANYCAILHEHVRLQPYIRGAMPGPLRKLVTSHLMEFDLGDYQHEVDEDVEPWGDRMFPETLAKLGNAELIDFLSGEKGWDKTPDNLAGSRASDWSDIQDRMNFIVDLFRSRHLDDRLFAHPFTQAQRQQILAGKVPAGPL